LAGKLPDGHASAQDLCGHLSNLCATYQIAAQANEMKQTSKRSSKGGVPEMNGVASAKLFPKLASFPARL
jgi:hypothetical protein